MAQPESVLGILKSILWPSSILFILFYIYPCQDEQMSFAHNMSFLNIFLLCIPFIRRKWAVIIFVCAITVVLINVDRRTILINTVIATLLSMSVFVIKRRIVRRILFSILIGAPLIFLYLGITDRFNVFQMMSMSEYSITDDSRALLTDSRTGIYEDVFYGLKKKNAEILGLGIDGKVETSLSYVTNTDYYSLYKYGRPSTESGMLNYIQYGGFIGFFAYSLFLICAAFKAVFWSNNRWMILIGLFVAFKFLYSFIEDAVSFKLTTFYLFLMIGMCYNRRFRAMTDEEVKGYLNLIFK